MPIKHVEHREGSKPVKIWTDEFDSNSLEQLANTAKMPFIHKHVAAMPDVHLGIGATVGSVIATKGAIIPAAVGVDIGCGMNAVRLSLTASDLPDSLRKIRDEIENAVPVGFSEHSDPALGDNGLYTRITSIVDRQGLKVKPGKVANQMGTLGGGNHFIELCLDESGDVWVMLHSGSRGIGNIIGTHFIALAKEDMRRHFINLPDQDLAYLPEGTDHYDAYMNAVETMQEYAAKNREIMMVLILNAIRRHLPPFTVTQEAINCHHNYVAMENHYGANVHVTRKGAIRARKGDLGIIPGSMGAKSFIVRGRGNAESFHSCSHGAGRKMSRKQAKETFTETDLAAQTAGVECRKDGGVVDEIPGAYKDIDGVMENQTDLIEIVHTLRQVVNVKG